MRDLESVLHCRPHKACTEEGVRNRRREEGGGGVGAYEHLRISLEAQCCSLTHTSQKSGKGSATTVYTQLRRYISADQKQPCRTLPGLVCPIAPTTAPPTQAAGGRKCNDAPSTHPSNHPNHEPRCSLTGPHNPAERRKDTAQQCTQQQHPPRRQRRCRCSPNTARAAAL